MSRVGSTSVVLGVFEHSLPHQSPWRSPFAHNQTESTAHTDRPDQRHRAPRPPPRRIRYRSRVVGTSVGVAVLVLLNCYIFVTHGFTPRCVCYVDHIRRQLDSIPHTDVFHHLQSEPIHTLMFARLHKERAPHTIGLVLTCSGILLGRSHAALAGCSWGSLRRSVGTPLGRRC